MWGGSRTPLPAPSPMEFERRRALQTPGDPEKCRSRLHETIKIAFLIYPRFFTTPKNPWRALDSPEEPRKALQTPGDIEKCGSRIHKTIKIKPYEAQDLGKL